MDPEQLKALFAQLLQPLQSKLDSMGAMVDALQQTKATPPPAKEEVPPKKEDTTQPPASTDPALNAQVAEMKRFIEADRKKVASMEEREKAANERADQAERGSIVDRALSGFQFREGTARETAITLLRPHIKRNEAGQLIAGDNLTVEAFVKDFIPQQHDYLLAPMGGPGGAGVVPGSTFAGGRKTIDLNDIKAGMSADVRAEAAAAIQAALQ